MGFNLAILVGVERNTGMKFSIVVPQKGTFGKYASNEAVNFIHEQGCAFRDVVIKSDQENSMKYVIEDVCMARTGAKTVKMNSPVKSSGSNGVVERAAQAVEGQLRTMKDALDTRYGQVIPVEHCIVVWLVKYVSILLNKMEIGHDGKTAEQRGRGRKSAVLGLEFGERVLYKKRLESSHMEKLLPRWEYGVFVGIKQRSAELLIMAEDGLKVVRSARRVPVEERWLQECLDWVNVVPWNLGSSDKRADGELPETVRSGPARELTEGERGNLAARPTRIYPEFKIMQADLERLGYTHGCPGCSSRLRGLQRQPHNKTCRERFEQLLKTEAFVANEDAQKAGHEKRVGNDGAKDEQISVQTDVTDDVQMESSETARSSDDMSRKRQSEMSLEELEANIGQIICSYDNDFDMEISQIICGNGTDFDMAWDDVNNMELPVDKVREARAEEMGHMKEKVFEIATKRECWEKTGKAPKSTKWVDTDKSHGHGDMLVRSRWVARDFKTRGERDREDLFCATPPLELIRFLVSRQATRSLTGRMRKSLFIDVKKAHLIPKCDEDVYVDLPAEAGAGNDECGKLLYWLYGCRRAGQAWEDHYSDVLVAAGFRRGKASPVIFYHPVRDLWCVVHGDDFIFTGFDGDLDFAMGIMKDNYSIKNRGRLGPDEDDVQTIDILGRVLEYHPWGISWKADPRHRKMLLEHFGFNGQTKNLTRNGSKEEDEVESTGRQLQKEEETAFRAIAARANYMAADCPNVQFPAKEVCRDMAKPTVASYEKVKKLARYLAGFEEVRFEYVWQDEDDIKEMNVYTDSDWAGCRSSRKSTSGGAIVLGKHCLKTWSSTQSTVAMSSAEAEYYAMVEGATRGLGLQTMLQEMGVHAGVLVASTDSSSAKSFASKRGLGKIRHMEVKELWLQEAVCRGRVKLKKIEGEKNPADLFTKYLSSVEIGRHLSFLNVHLEPRANIL